MNTLVIHPKDSTTDFLKPIYNGINNKTVVTGGVTKSKLRELIKKHDRVIILGHGSPYGLLNVYERFKGAGPYIIDGSMVPLFQNQPNNIYIWCHASEYFNKYNLKGFATSMFISEVSEAEYYGFNNVTQDEINISNDSFANALGDLISLPLNEVNTKLKEEYGMLSESNGIIQYNLNGFCCRL